ncbi:translocation/assembly module TamB domain-containing protein [Novosphingobium bradum]|uniref:Translocation/assembly module TamB domain-containing protein n=1 Tax=Novosphingobium bradum TaxID=1737444 RepID=A0ABV7IRH4_9SPHN
MPEAPEPAAPAADVVAAPAMARRGRLHGWLRWIAVALAGLLALVAIGLLVLESPIGHRFVVDRIARYAPASGLRVEIGRIDGSLMGAAYLRDVTFSDPDGLFLRVPVVELDWRPLRWFTSGLDVRKLVLRQGLLYRGPHLRPGDPDAPLLPDFDIRVDRFQLDRLTVAKGIFGEQRRIDLRARADIRKGRVFLRLDSRLGGQDRLQGTLDSEPRRDRFALKVDVNAPRGGFLATLAGAKDSLAVRVDGAGRYAAWTGRGLVSQPGLVLADLALANRGGRYSFSGPVRPDGFLGAIAARAAGPEVAVSGEGTLASSVLSGRFSARGRGALLGGNGTIDLARNAFRQVRLDLALRDPDLFGPGLRVENARASATLDGAFREVVIDHRITADRLLAGGLRAERLVQEGPLTRANERWTFPLNLTAARVVTGSALIDGRAPGKAAMGGHARGTIRVAGTRVWSDPLEIGIPGLGAALVLSGDTRTGAYRLAGPVAARDLALANLGAADADLTLDARFGAVPWLAQADLRGRMARVTNATLTTLAGTGLRFAGHVAIGRNQPLLLQRMAIEASKLALRIDGRVLPDGTITLGGTGRHADYGPFTVQAQVAGDGPRAVLVFAHPLPAAGLKDVRVALAPIPQGFRIETAGQSRLGPFAGTLGLFAPPGGQTRIEVEKLAVWKTAVSGTLVLVGGAAQGTLALAGGGVDGTIGLAPRGGGQGFDVALTVRDARFGGDTPLAIGAARINAAGTLAQGHATVSGNGFAEGVQSGSLFIGRLAANAALADGKGQVTASLAGRRGSRFALQLVADIAPDEYRLLASGSFAGERIAMPRRAVLSRTAQGWSLAPAQVDFAGGRIIASGSFGAGTTLDLALSDLPLALADIYAGDLGLAGQASGTVAWRQREGAAPAADARLEIKGLSRSGLVLTSRPVDLSLVARLGERDLEMRALIREGAAVRGRLQGRIDALPAAGSLGERLAAGALAGQLRYAGPADALWRLVALETFDLTGPLDLAADVSGTLRDPQIRGTLASTDLRLQSALTGTDIRGIAARGSFAGSRLQLATFAGRARNGGMVSGSGEIDLAGLGGGRGPALDLRLAARGAEIVSRDDMAATVTGPIRILSDGQGGTIAGRLAIDSARWTLGRASVAAALPGVTTREINLPYDIAPARAPATPWRYLIDARGRSRIQVRGLGLDSEWGADLRLRGTTTAPAIAGRADLVRGGYDFAGKRFELTRGAIHFDGNAPPDPRLDIAASADMTGLTATVTVTGTSNRPEIRFSSVPALPEEELLSRLLFGSSITQLSAPEAVQIGAALASLRGGGGLDPINKLRSAIGLDRLRIVGADAALGRGTSIAVGKNIGQRIYVEIVSDGKGYNATQLEYRVTRWLSLLGTISSIGRQGIDAKISKDY